MFTRFYFYGLLALPVISSLTGCTNVEPWDRNILAKDSMTVMPDNLGALVRNELEYGREGTEGAVGINAGGCGCN
jgi:hypothetical protein